MVGRRRSLCGENDPVVPDHLRCSRNDGRSWRCPRRRATEKDATFCDHHYLQAQQKYAAKIGPSPAQNPRSCRGADPEQGNKRRGEPGGEMILELVRAAVRRQMERREERERRRRMASAAPVGEEVILDLPNAVMSIPSASARESSSVAAIIDLKIGFDGGAVDGRRFRSKNLEPIPIGPTMKLKCRKGFRKGWRRVCEKCGESKVVRLVRCSSGRKKAFCTGCIEKWWLSVQTVQKLPSPALHTFKKTGFLRRKWFLSIGHQHSSNDLDEPVPDHLRCRRSDGRHWRCPLRAAGGISFCHHHHVLAQRNILKHKSSSLTNS